MSRKRHNKKIRTRSHIIADISANYVERYALLNGFSVERFEKDYGYDLNIYTYSKNGEIENGNIFIQLKASDDIVFIKKNNFISFQLDKRDLNQWLDEPMPCVLVVYDAKQNKAYWIYIQAHFETITNFNIGNIGNHYNINIPITNRINKKSISKFRDYKSDVLKQISGIISHNA